MPTTMTTTTTEYAAAPILAMAKRPTKATVATGAIIASALKRFQWQERRASLELPLHDRAGCFCDVGGTVEAG